MDDLISRQEATTIPVMPKEHREYQTYNLDDAYELGWHDLQDYIKELPSVQIDFSDYSDKLWTLAYERGKASAQKIGHWIPCSERLPEEKVEVLASTKDGFLYIASVDDWNGTIQWSEISEYRFLYNVTAWQPLPEPWRGEQE